MRTAADMATGRLSTCLELLDTIATSTEEDFLNIAIRLKDIRDRTSRISELAASVVGFVSGDVMVDAIKELNALTLKASDCLMNSSRKIENAIAKLEEISTSIDAVRVHIEGMNRLTRNLCRIGVITKIENSSLRKRETGLDSLSEDVGLLSENILKKTRDISDGRAALRRTISKALASICDIGEMQSTETAAVIDTTGKSISLLAEKYHLSAGLADEISLASDEMSRSILEIVTSVQFHDITRQQLEHSKKALEDALRGAGKKPDQPGLSFEQSGNCGEDMLRDMYRVCISEPLQLKRVRAELVTAARSVIRNLSSLSGQMNEMLCRTRKISGRDFASGSFLVEIEDVLSSITATISALAEDTTMRRELSEVITVTVATAREMLDFADGIEKIGVDVGLLAINASVNAHRIGNEGRPFRVIADSISHISSDARVHTEAISGTFRVISALAEELWNDTLVCGETEGADTSADLERLIASLHSINREMAQAFNDIEASEQILSGEIEDIIVGTDIHVKVDRAVEKMLSLLSLTVSELEIGNTSALLRGRARGDAESSEDEAYRKALSSRRLNTEQIGSGGFGDNVALF